MNNPEITILAVSNVYCRLMNFKNKGDQEHGHYHDYDHGTLLASGKLRVDKSDENGNVLYSKIFVAPTFIFIEKGARHVLTAEEDNTVATCIHALRTIDENIIASDFFVEEKVLADSPEVSSPDKPVIGQVMRDRGLLYKTLARSN